MKQSDGVALENGETGPGRGPAVSPPQIICKFLLEIFQSGAQLKGKCEKKNYIIIYSTLRSHIIKVPKIRKQEPRFYIIKYSYSSLFSPFFL